MTREEAIEHLNTIGIYYSQDHSDPYGECARLTKDELDAICLAIKALEQEPCEDAISRQAVDALIDELEKAISDEWCCISRGRNTATIMRDIRHLPPAKPEPKMGHWIHFASGDDCSECGWSTGKYISPSKYCPDCGVKMQE